MIDLEELKKRLLTPCGRTTGHGERCATGWECSACAEKKNAADAIERLQRELEEARSLNSRALEYLEFRDEKMGGMNLKHGSGKLLADLRVAHQQTG